MKHLFLFALVGFLLLGGNAQATTWYVNHAATGSNNGTSWTNAYTDLQDAINIAWAGDEVWVAAGTYKPSQYTQSSYASNTRNKTFFLNKKLKIYGGFSGTENALSQRNHTTNVTILSGDIGVENDKTDNCYHVFITANLTSTALLDGFTITEGNANNASGSISFGGTTFYTYAGGGMYNMNSSPSLKNLLFVKNTTSYYGGGMYNSSSSPVLANVSFVNNSATGSSGEGGAMYNTSSSPTLTDVSFISNSVYHHGGGVYNTSSSPTFTNVSFVTNTATSTGSWGGGMYSYLGSPKLTNVTFAGNSSNHVGGALANHSTSPVLITNASFRSNLASDGGGAIFNHYASPSIVNASFTDNWVANSSTQGGAIRNDYSSSPSIKNSILWDNGSVEVSGGGTFQHSIVKGSGGSSAWKSSYGTNSGGNLDADPLFVSSSNLSLQAGSPAINTGENSYNTSSTDLAGNPRVVNTTIDMGAYEYGAQPCSLSVVAASTNASCNANNGSINLTVSGGSGSSTYLWNDGSTLQNRSNLGAGTYSVTVTNGSCTASASATISQPTALSIAATPISVSCNGGNNGSINVVASGGNGVYTYLWNDGSTLQNRTNLGTGTYIVTVTDNQGCTGNATAKVEQAASLVVTPTTTNLSCYGSNNGSINLAVSGGNSSYSYLWNDGSTLKNRTNLAANAYTVSVTDGNGCTASITANVLSPTAINISASVTHLSYGGGNGAINLTISGGTTPYTYLWNDGSTLQNRNNLAANTYTVTVTDSKGCAATTTATVLPPFNLTLTATPTNISCATKKDGSISLTASGGTAPYTYLWNNKKTTASISGLSAGTYTCTVTDATGATATISQTVTAPALLSLSQIVSPVLCNGGNTGAINLTAKGGTAPYSFSWNTQPKQTTEDLANLPKGSYKVTVTDANGCPPVVKTVTVSEPTALAATFTSTNIVCNGSSTGSLSVTPLGGVAPYNYLWSNGSTAQGFAKSLAAGTYTVTITDKNGCTKVQSRTLTEQPALAITDSIEHVSCHGEKDGAITLSVSGGVAPYKYIWNNGKKTQNIFDLKAKTYTCTVKDAKGCKKSSTFVIAEPTKLAATALATPVSCYGSVNGGIVLTPTGGTPPYSYAWSNGATTKDLSSIAAGDYTCTITDANGCSFTQTTTVDQPTQPMSIAATAQSVTCFGGSNGSIELTLDGGSFPYSFAWSNGATSEDLYQQPAGTYACTVTDANGCTQTITQIIGQPAVALALAGSVSNVSCYGGKTGSINVAATGGTTPYTYLWSNGATTKDLANIGHGIYTLNVADTNGCKASQIFGIVQPSPLFMSVGALPVACYGDSTGSLQTTAIGGTLPYAFSWNTGATTKDLVHVGAGFYTNTLTDANGCTITKSANVFQPAKPLIAVPSVTDVSCFGGNNGASHVFATGGTLPYTYNWSNGVISQGVQNLSAGIYQVIVTDKNGCADTAATMVAQPSSTDTTYLETTTCDPTQVGIAPIVLTNQYGCDSVIVVNSILLPTDTTYLVFNSADSTAWGETVYTLTNQYGCDSIVVMIVDDFSASKAANATNSTAPVLHEVRKTSNVANRQPVAPVNTFTVNNYATRLYPNPANTELNIALEKVLVSEVHIAVFAATGQLVESRTTTNTNVRFNTTDWANGLYFVKIRNGEHLTTQKVMIQH